MRYKHDCTKCKPLGALEEYDLYFCEQSFGWPTVIARFSSNGPDYVSGIYQDMENPLKEAKVRAIDLGYLPSKNVTVKH